MNDLRNYAIVTAAYWGFTLTDGALRMLVLLHFHELGFSPLDLAFLFLLYEAMGIATNFFGGWLGARFGLRLTLVSGLALQVVTLLALSAVGPDWQAALSVIYVMAMQALSGIAKDLTKMSSKSAVKLVVAEDAQGRLFRWVAMLTGSKNALKGLGFLLGGLGLSALGFQSTLWTMAAALALVLLGLVTTFSGDLGKAKTVTRRDLFAKKREINLLSVARIFLFAARDVWFVVGVPIFLYSVLGWSFAEVGSFMAFWVIGYGLVQAAAPKLLRRTEGALAAARGAIVWGAILALLPAALAIALGERTLPWPSGTVLIAGIYTFGAVFALNSALHSYLIVAYSDRDKVALNVGFYYMANAVGRLLGTLLSGLVYQYWGLTACLWTSALFVSLAVAFTVPLRRPL